jgi:hypothetical protein
MQSFVCENFALTTRVRVECTAKNKKFDEAVKNHAEPICERSLLPAVRLK